jgi:hypothetical protein
MSDCVFCKIRDGQIPSMKIYEDERTLCIMDINPLNSGHCLVLTRAHAATIFDRLTCRPRSPRPSVSPRRSGRRFSRTA